MFDVTRNKARFQDTNPINFSSLFNYKKQPYFAVLLLTTILTGSNAIANPEGGKVAEGIATLQQQGSSLNIGQFSDKVILDWDSFNIGNNEQTKFIQPNTNSVALNRIHDQNPTQILGKLSANGKLFLVNPNGFFVGKDAQINVGSIVASTTDITNQNFMSGNYLFDKLGNADAKIINNGYVSFADAGMVALIAPHLENNGIIKGKLGKVVLASGDIFALDTFGDNFTKLAVSDQVKSQLIEQKGLIEVENGEVYLTAPAAKTIVNSLINLDGEIKAQASQGKDGSINITMEPVSDNVTSKTNLLNIHGKLDVSSIDVKSNGGKINIKARTIHNNGQITADGNNGGAINIVAKNIINHSGASAQGTVSFGGTINYSFENLYLDHERTINNVYGQFGGNLNILGEVGSKAFLSANELAKGERAGGNIKLSASVLEIRAAKFDASGNYRGGSILLGGDYQGSGDMLKADQLTVNSATTFAADAKVLGDGGRIIAWSEQETSFSGEVSAAGGSQGGDGGLIEVSSHDKLGYGGKVTETLGSKAKLLLDPKNINIFNSLTTGGMVSFNFVDPSASPGTASSSGFGGGYFNIFNNGNVLISNPNDSIVAANSGAIYLFNGSTGGLISTFTGANASDAVGSTGLPYTYTLLPVNNNLLVTNYNWNSYKGVAFLVNSASGISGSINITTSLIGSNSGTSSTGDRIGIGGVTALGNGNYVLRSYYWNGGSTNGFGAATWGSGSTGVTGIVSASNSLTGSNTGDQVGINVSALSNNNYFVTSLQWSNYTGAVTWGNGATGISGVVSSLNSLVGSNINDQVGTSAVVLNNGNYVILSPRWNGYAGAVTWVNSNTGLTGIISSSNSLVGSNSGTSVTGDYIGSSGVSALGNNNYVIKSPQWNGGSTNGMGAVTWGDGTIGVNGVVSSANSLTGSISTDKVGSSGVQLLAGNNNYVVISSSWNTNAGAATWGNGATGISGVVSSSNSLVGSNSGSSTTGDKIGYNGVTSLSNGNYLVRSQTWNGGTTNGMGAVTWGNGAAGTSGVVSSSNSLVGIAAKDYVGNTAPTILTNGNYLITSSNWNNYAGAVSWGSATTGVSGLVSNANSLVGSNSGTTTTGDKIGLNGIISLANSNYLVKSSYWNGGNTNGMGAITFGNGSTGVQGVVSSANSLVGSYSADKIGITTITILSNGNYVIPSPNWNSYTGAVTWGSATNGVSGIISSSNSLIGTNSGTSSTGDQIGTNAIIALTNGNYVAPSPYWSGGTTNGLGAVTWGNGNIGTTGVVSSANSLVGSTAGDLIGLTGITALTNGNYIVRSNSWHNGAVATAGAVTWGSGTSGVTGVVSSTNSLVGSTTNDQVGAQGVTALTNGNYVVITRYWDNGAAVDAGAVTWGSGTVGVSGIISASNSLVGSTTNDQLASSGILALSNGNYVVTAPNWSTGGHASVGAATWGDGTIGVSGIISASNSLIGSSANDQVGLNSPIYTLSNGNYIVRSGTWNNGATGQVGALTWANGATGIVGAVSPSNSLVGSTAGNLLGSSTSFTTLSNGNYLIYSPSFKSGANTNAGLYTLGSATSGVSGIVSTSNSVIGTVASTSSVYKAENTTYNYFVVALPAESNAGRVVAVANNFEATGNQAFATNPSASVPMNGPTIATTLTGGTNVTLQANNDIILGTNIIATGSTGGALTMQAGRSILLNGNITTANGALTLTANETLANGVVDAYRDAGNAAITMASGTTLNSGTANTIVTLSNGLGKTNLSSGNITLDNIISNNLLVNNNGPTLGSSILPAQASSLITATSSALALSNVNNSSGNIGSSSSPLRLTTTNVSALSQGGSIYLSSPTASINLGGATLGGLTGINSGLGNFAISGAANITDSQVLNIGGAANFTTSGVGSIINLTQASSYLGAVSLNTNSDVNANATINNVITNLTLANSTIGGTLFAKTSGNITIPASQIITANKGITLVAGGNFYNNSGSGALVSPAGNWSVYSTNPASDNVGGLSNNFRRFSCTYGGSCPAFPGGQNGLFYSRVPVVMVSPTAFSLVYGSNVPSLTNYSYNLNGYLDNDLVADVRSGSLSGSTNYVQGNNIGNYNINYSSGNLTSSIGYQFSYVNNPQAITVNPLSLSANGLNVKNKTYDGTTIAIIDTSASNTFGVLAGDSVTINSGSGNFATSNVGNNIPVTANNFSLSGHNSSNYVISAPNLSANITAKPLSFAATTANNKVYDGTNLASLNTFNSLQDLVASDVSQVTIDTSKANAYFATSNAGNNIPVTVTGLSLLGTNANNYNITQQPTNLAANITPKPLSIIGVLANNVAYSGSALDTLNNSNAALSGVLSSDINNVSLDSSLAQGYFIDAKIGQSKAVSTKGYSIKGSASSNYNLVMPTNLTANINLFDSNQPIANTKIGNVINELSFAKVSFLTNVDSIIKIDKNLTSQNMNSFKDISKISLGSDGFINVNELAGANIFATNIKPLGASKSFTDNRSRLSNVKDDFVYIHTSNNLLFVTKKSLIKMNKELAKDKNILVKD